MAKALTIVPKLAAVEALSDFDGRTVGATAIKVTNAGDGLSQALQVDPQEFQLGDTVYVVLETTVAKVEHGPITEGDQVGPLCRSHSLRAGAATIVDKDLVAEQLRVQTVRIKAALEEAAERQHGIQVVPGTGWADEDAEADAQGSMYDDGDPDDDGDPEA